MKTSQQMKRFCSLLLAVVMVVSMLPVTAFAAQADGTLTASLAEAKSYIDGITINNSSNDPATVVKNFKTHFTWDNEKRENSKSYLFDWSYYNGVVFEGIEYVYEVTGEQVYADYVIEYMSSLITSSGGWATCSNDSSKQCAGYNATHGADCYKTASLLMDSYEMTGDSRYLTMAKTLYADLDSAANSYSLKNAGMNYRHTWASDPSPDLWLDGLYMILPFRAEYAKYIGDTAELDLIVDRMQWVSDNMYNTSKGLFYHAADSASSNSGTYWLRSIGWYAAAIVDIMDSMEGENLEAMKRQLVKLVDGMRACQNSSNGMWLNNMNASLSSSNPYETSGTALTCYAVMKAVNKGWLDESYADMAILAFNGICNEKLSGSTLTDICFKGAPGSSNSTFYDNEGKGVGPFIMFYAEVLKYVNTEEVPEETVPEETEPEETVPEETEPEETIPEETVPEETVPEETVPGEAVSVQGSGNLVGSTVYTLDSDGVNSGEKYLIVYSSKALQNNNGVDANPAVTISNNTITLSDDSKLAWTITQSGSNYYVENNGSYLNLTASGNDPIGSSATVSITRSGSTYKIRNTASSGAYLRYSNSQLFCAGTSNSNNSMYLYRRTGAGAGSAVTFTVSADTNTLKPGQALALNGTVTLAGSAVDLGSCTITWSSSNASVATVSGGTVSGIAGGNATITATLTAVGGKDLVNPIALTIPVSVYSHSHSYQAVVTAPTCTAEGYTTYTCDCGDTYTADYTAALGHSYESVTVDATCAENGSVTYTCHCGNSYVEVIPAKGHDYISVVTDPTCTEEGFTTNTCANCGDSYVSDETAALGHSYESVTVEATCTENGSVTYTCHCGHSYMEVIPATGHDYTSVVTAPTCTEEGFTTYTCHCGNSYVGDFTEALGHDYRSLTLEPTCEAAGYTTHTCRRCAYAYTSDYSAALGHDYVSVVTAPTCETAGFTTHTCSRCDHAFVDSHVDALGHDYQAVVTAPTCTAGGYTTNTCANCGDSFISDDTAALGHNNETVTVDATCITDGSVTTTCTVCGETTTEVIPAKGHAYERVVTDPTCTEEGFTTNTCANCGDSYVSDETAALGHSYESVTVEATCTENGSVTYTCHCGHSYMEVIPATGHDYTSVVTAPTCTEEGFTTYTCACGDSYISDETAALGHNYQTVVTAPTCTAGGYTTNTCAYCGDSFISDETAALGHDYVSVVTAPTCETAGFTTHTCSRCDHAFVDSHVDALGHDYQAVVTAPTCTAGGFTTNTCANCGDSFISDDTAALGHNNETVTVDATCTADGSVTTTCTVCGETTTEVIPATGHAYKSVVTDPTCTEEGFTTNTCANCGDTYVSDETAALGHSYESATVDATCTADGSVTYTCHCGDSYMEVIPAKGHDYTSVVTAPTCTEEGFTTYTCHCGDSYVSDETAALGHDYESVVVDATCTEQGYTIHTCTRCGHSYTDNYVSAKFHAYMAEVTEATCTTDGFITYTCVCGFTYTEVIPATGHAYESAVTAPTCTAQGFTTNTCANCGDTYVSDKTAALGHAHESVTVEATCTENGSITYTCHCGDSYSVSLPATGHSYTCTESDGCLNYVCGSCGDSYTEIINWIAMPGTYVLDTDGIDVGKDHKYIVVGSSKDYALTLSGTTVGASAVTIVDNTITLDDASRYEFYFVSNSRESGSYLLTQDGSKSIYHSVGNLYYGTDSKGYWHFGSASKGNYQLWDSDWGTWYLNYGYVWGSNSTNCFAVSSTARTVRLFKATDSYVRLSGSMHQTYAESCGTTAVTEADILAKLAIQLSKDGSTASGTEAVTASMLSWDAPLDGNTAGTYTAAVTYKDQILGTITVTITPKHTFETVTTAPTCTAGGSTVSTCTACGHSVVTGETAALGHSYTCTESGDSLVYTCGRCGHSYAEALRWTSLDGIYVLDTDGVDIGSDHKYLVVGGTANYALTRSGSTVTTTAVTVSGNTIVLNNSACEFYFADNSSQESGSYLLTQDGSRSVYHVGGNINYGHDSKGYWHIGSGSNGSYQLYDYDNVAWYLNYGYVWASQSVSRFAVSSNARTVRLFKAAEGYIRLSGALSQTCTSTTEAAVLAQLTIQQSTDGSTVSGTQAVTADMVTWNTAFNGSVPGTYTGTVTCLGQNLGTITVIVSG